MTQRQAVKKPVREANMHDRPCDECGTPMIGIMRLSDYGKSEAPRKVCYSCERELKKNGV